MPRSSRRSVLVLGGARSGKSAYAESLLVRAPLLYVATGQAGDAEMQARIKAHRDRRGPHWITVEEPLDLAGALKRHRAAFSGVLVDCLTLWLSNLMMAERNVEAEIDILCAVIENLPVPLVLVSSEVGMGLVPDSALGRDFRDWQGLINQQVAKVCTKVVFVAAGLPLVLKDDK